MLAGSSLVPGGVTVDFGSLARRVTAAADLRLRTRYDDLAAVLPGLLADLYSEMERSSANRGRLHELLAHTYNHAPACLYGLGSLVAGHAAERGAEAATRAGDPVLTSILMTNQAMTLLQRGAYDAVDRLTGRAREVVGGAAPSPEVVTALGYAHLRSAVCAARAGNAAVPALHLDEARACAQRLPATANLHGTAFNTDNVAAHAVARAVELGEAGRALSLRLPEGRGMTASRHAHLHIDLARASLLHGDRERTLAELSAARRSSPQITRYHPQALDVLRTLALKDRRRTRSLSAFARWAGARI